MMSDLTKAIAAFVPMLAMGTVTYDGVTYPTSASEAAGMGYVTLSSGGNYYLDSPFGTSPTSNNGTYYWSDHGAPDPAKNYYATGCRSVTGKTDHKCSFGGNLLVLSGSYNWKTQNPYYMDFPREGVVILPGAKFFDNQAVNKVVEQKITGTMTVLSTSASPFVLQPTAGAPTPTSINVAGFDLACTLRGPATAAIRCEPIGNGAARGWLRVTGETSEYLGSLNVHSNDLYVGACGLANASFVSLTQTAVLRPYAADGETVTITNLSLDGSCEIVLNPSNCLFVASALSLADNTAIRFEIGTYSGGTTHRAIMTAPAGSGIESHLRDWDHVLNETWRSATLSVETAGGRETVYLDLADANSLVKLLSSDGDASWENGRSAFTNVTQWSDGQTVHGGADYLVRNGFTLRTLEEGRYQSATFPMTYPKFPGTSLTIWYDSSLALRQTRMEFDMLRLAPRAILHLGNTHTKYVTGNILLLGSDSDDPATIRAYYTSVNRTNYVNATISGTGALQVHGQAGSGDPRGHVQLGGINTNWTGRTIVSIGTTTVEGRETPTWRNTQFLHVTNALALGAARAAFTYNALQLEQCGALCVENRNAVVLDTPNRGVFVKDWGQMIVGADSSLTIKNDVTYYGELRKTGPGLLAFGGTARFGVGGTASPTTLSNVLNVVEGTFKPLSARCLDGVAATFGSGARLAFDLSPADATFKAKGIVLEKPASSLTFADATVPVAIDCGDAPFDGTIYTFGLVTADETTVQALKAKLKVANPRTGYVVETSVAPSEGGLWTLFAKVRPSGCCVIIR